VRTKEGLVFRPQARGRSIFASGSWADGIAYATKLGKSCTTNACKANTQQTINIGLNTYKAALGSQLDEILSLEAINAAAMRISADLTATAATYAAAQQINATRSQSIRGDYTKLLAQQTTNANLIMKWNADVLASSKRGRIVNGII